MTNLALTKYHVVFQYYTNTQKNLPDLITKEDFFDSYKKAKKEALKFLKTLKASNKTIEKAFIEPVFLEENLLGNQ